MLRPKHKVIDELNLSKEQSKSRASESSEEEKEPNENEIAQCNSLFSEFKARL